MNGGDLIRFKQRGKVAEVNNNLHEDQPFKDLPERGSTPANVAVHLVFFRFFCDLWGAHQRARTKISNVLAQLINAIQTV